MNRPPASADPAPNAFERIEAVCRDFRDRFKRGERPSVEDYLGEFDDLARVNAFRNLLNIELEFRRRAKQTPTSDEYIQRFPQFARLIRQAFFESTMMSLAEFNNTPNSGSMPDHGDASGEHDHVPSSPLRGSEQGEGGFSLSTDERAAAGSNGRTVSFVIPAANRLGDYLLLRELGRGGFGIVYAARHARRRETVALKTLPLGDGSPAAKQDAERLHKFRREFRSLANINHPNLVGMQTLEVDAGQWFFTMDLIDGVDFLSYVRPDEQLVESRLRAVLPQLASGIMALHARHIIHRDLKPSNVLVDERGKVVILDFGLVAELEQAGDQTQSLQSGHFAGTPLYAAPEQMFGQRSAASDWYALGIMLYEALTGERPFLGTASEILREKQNRPPPKLAERDDLPGDLASLTDELLEREPERRPDALAIAKKLSVDGSQTPTTPYAEGTETLTFERDQSLIGRDQQLRELEHARRELFDRRQPVAVFISGRSGEGKTSLAEAFLNPLRLDRDTLILSGRCYDRESVPFKALDCLIDALVTFLRGCPGEVVQACIPDDMPMLAHLFPVLRRVEAIGALPSSNVANLDGKQVQDRGFAALRQMLIRISQRRPIALFVDDLQWGDAESAAVLHRLLSPPEAPAVLFLGTYRSDEAAESPFLQQWEKLSSDSEAAVAQREIAVGPLSEPQCVAMVAGRVGIDNELIRSQAARLYRDTGGNPYFIEQLIECFDPETGSFTPAPLQEVIARRLGKLPAVAAELLQVIAVFGQAMSIDEAFAVLGQEKPSFATITHMRSERLVRLLGSEEQRTVDTYHDKIRETVVSGLSAEQRRTWHRQIGEMIERVDGIDAQGVIRSVLSAVPIDLPAQLIVRPSALAHHFDQANEREKALVYAVLAAESARRQFAHEAAVISYEIAKMNLSPSRSATHYRLYAGLGESLVQLGRHEEAMIALNTAIESAQDPVDINAIRMILADSEYRHGSVERSVEIFEQVLSSFGVSIPKTQFGALTRVCFGLPLKFLWCSILSRFRTKRMPDKRSRLILKVLTLLPYPYHSSGLPKCLWCCFVASTKSSAFPETSLTASLEENHGNGWTLLGAKKRADRYYQKAIECAERQNDLGTKANIYRIRGAMTATAGYMDAGLQFFDFPISEYENRLMDRHRLFVTMDWKGRAHYLRGDLLQAAQLASRVFSQTLNLGVDRWAVSAIQSWTRAVEGKLPLPDLIACVRSPGDLASTVLLKNAEVDWYLATGQFADAVKSADDGIAVFRNYWPMKSFNCSIVGNAARAHREYAIQLSASDPHLCSKHWKMARQYARYGLLRVQLWRCEHPRLLREFSLASAALGSLRRALRAARKSYHIAEQQGARYELAQSRLVVAELSQKLGLAGADQLLHDATQELQRFKDMIDQAVAETVKP